MKTIEERAEDSVYWEGYKEAIEDAKEWLKMHLAEWSQMDDADLKKEAMNVAIVCLREKKELVKKYKALIDMLIDELHTSRAYHLGITGLDSDAEIARKEREGDTALIRGIDRTIKYVRKAMEESPCDS